ncbi:Cullin-3 [Seminavis robusta]|uniref:Cullin-3 n=1 Tax=Seminavis robusta TaxID=568900 RepID=A0A9N8EIN5_9STRA|nr:Cullin-3 [Seminavis robusta]|eukprot:Sro1262_g257110.1 Cullin-3 (770) ;mRNA; f:6940-9781
MSDSKKRFNIKPFRTHVPMDRNAAQQIWEILANAIDEIYNRNASQLSFEELYRNAYNLVLHKHGTLLYDGVTEKLSSHLLNTVNRLADIEETKLLDEMASTWSEHQITMVMIHDILMYMDRTYVQQQRRRPVYPLGLHLFRITVWEHPRIKDRVTQLLLDAIAAERAGLLTDDRSLLKASINMLLELGRADFSNVYERDFDRLFLGTTQEFYRNESLSYLSQNSATAYVSKAIKRLEEERERSAALALPATTEAPLQNIVETELIERHARTLVDMENSGFAALLKDDTKLEEMREMYDLFIRVPSSVDNLRDALAERIKADGKKLIEDQQKGSSDPPAFVRGVLAMRERYERIVSVSFRGEKKTQKRMREAFEDFLNVDARASSCLAVYVDELLRTGLRGATEEQVTEQLQKVIIVFRYLSDKDVFESFYKQHLAKRLLGNRSVSDDAERAMVSQLKAECGYQFTSKLEGMFNDMRISRDMRDTYKNYRRSQSQQQGKLDMEVDVLTNGYWPSQNVPPCTLPQLVQDAIKNFETFYLEKHTGRKLSWQTSAGAAELKGVFGKGPNKYNRHELCVSTYQMCILLLFNTEDTLTLGQIRTRTHIPDMELRRHLISLCTPKHRVLRKGSKGRGITSDDDTFSFNEDFSSKLKRVRIPLVKESSVVRADAAGGNPAVAGVAVAAAAAANSGIDGSIPLPVEEDRRHLVEAAIVRIMKARKTLHHNDLIAEVTKQLSVRFNPSPQFIKKRIESLIEREYLERSNDDRRVYNYCA